MKEFLFKSASFELGAREVMHKIARLPDFLDKPRRGEKLEPGSKDFDKNQAFGRGVGAAAATSLLTSPAAFMLARKGKGKAAAAVAASPLATGTATALANYRKRRKGK